MRCSAPIVAGICREAASGVGVASRRWALGSAPRADIDWRLEQTLNATKKPRTDVGPGLLHVVTGYSLFFAAVSALAFVAFLAFFAFELAAFAAVVDFSAVVDAAAADFADFAVAFLAVAGGSGFFLP